MGRPPNRILLAAVASCLVFGAAPASGEQVCLLNGVCMAEPASDKEKPIDRIIRSYDDLAQNADSDHKPIYSRIAAQLREVKAAGGDYDPKTNTVVMPPGQKGPTDPLPNLGTQPKVDTNPPPKTDGPPGTETGDRSTGAGSARPQARAISASDEAAARSWSGAAQSAGFSGSSSGGGTAGAAASDLGTSNSSSNAGKAPQADGIKNAFADGKMGAGALGGGPGGAMGDLAGGAKSGAPGSGSGAFGPSRPPADADLLRQAGPYSHVYQREGFKVAAGPDGRPRIVDKFGNPASAADKARLAQAIRNEPAALERNPGFFNPSLGGISRDDFSNLKNIYRNDRDKHAEDFKDIALTPKGEERDFTRDKSCEIVSGACNKHAKESYKKDDEVPASDLSSIMASIRSELSATAAIEREAEKRAGLSAVANKIRSAVSSMFGGDRRSFGGPQSTRSQARKGQAADRSEDSGASHGARAQDSPHGDRTLQASMSPRGITVGWLAELALGTLGAGCLGLAAFVILRKRSFVRGP
ncbi:MAG: hypothetical protein HY077_06610 [Elusimicrobia bacterium]|nr:hypothetical protein [Elusimicrobiota bacterium]